MKEIIDELLRGSSGDTRALEGELKRLIAYMTQKSNAKKARELMSRLREQSSFHRTRQTPVYFDKLLTILDKIKNFPLNEQLQLLGWACRLLRYEAIKQPPQQRRRETS